MAKYSQQYVLADLDALSTLVDGGELHLYKTRIPLVAANTAAIMLAVEATFDGYAAITLPTPLTPYQDGLETWSFQVPTQQFNYVDGVGHVTNDVIGAYVLDNAGVLVQSFEFPQPVTMANNLDSIPIDLKYTKSAL